MGIFFHSFGACTPFVGTGVAGALVGLGNSAKPGEIAEIFEHEPRMMDGAGKVPADYQAMGSEAEIIFTLGSYDPVVMAAVVSRSQGMGNIGAMLARAGHTFSLYLPSSTDDPWFFPCCFLTAPKYMPGMKSDDLVVRFKAFRPLGPTGITSAGTPLYTRVPPS